jgi:hypothetical protein
VVCFSVNDAFVMNEWGKAQEAGNITLIPDGNGDFSKGMGMLVDKSDLGFGKRSWRYSMLVRDGVIEKMFIEPEKEGDPFEVSDADTMLKYVAPDAVAPEPITLFSKPGCPFCAKAKGHAGRSRPDVRRNHAGPRHHHQHAAGGGGRRHGAAGVCGRQKNRRFGRPAGLAEGVRETKAESASPQQFLS